MHDRDIKSETQLRAFKLLPFCKGTHSCLNREEKTDRQRAIVSARAAKTSHEAMGRGRERIIQRVI